MVEDEYITSDLGEAAYLALILGFPEEFDRRNPRRVFFIFKGDKAFMEMKAKDYQEGKDRCKSFFDMTKSLKNAVVPRNTREQSYEDKA